MGAVFDWVGPGGAAPAKRQRQVAGPAPGAKQSALTVALCSQAAKFQRRGVLLITAAMAVNQ